MNILIIGGGGREHALAWSLSKSPLKPKLFITPGNGGTTALAETVHIDLAPPHRAVSDFCKVMHVGLVVIGPEKYLVEGMADSLRAAGIKVFGPGAAGARLEGSKAFAKEIMAAAKVPTAAHVTLTTLDGARVHLDQHPAPWVLKADGLAAGKGVIIAENRTQAEEALQDFFVKKAFGEAGTTLVIESFLKGYEVSILALTDGTTVKLLPPSQDHKRAFDHDQGPNTGGMGVYSPVPPVTAEHLKMVEEKVLLPTLSELKKRGIPYVGVLYAGLMIDGADLQVVEFNARFGDPETECVLPLLDSDLLPALVAATEGRLGEVAFSVKNAASATVIMASGGYPGFYETGKPITGLDDVKNSVVFHAGTAPSPEGVVSAGGRVLALTCVAPDLQGAIAGVYADVARIHFEKGFYRNDIGRKGLV